MKPKHLQARIAQCLALAACSPCPRRKFGAVLLDPARNVVLMDGYNGAPRGGGRLCGGERCLRDGLTEAQVRVVGPNGPDDLDVEDCWVQVLFPATEIAPAHWVGVTLDAGTERARAHGGREECLAYRQKLLAENPPIRSGTRMEIGCHHAEMNVICNVAASTVSSVGAWLIVTGEPCLMCAKHIHHAGIVKVMVVKGGYSGENGLAYLRAHGIAVEEVEGPQDPRSAT